MKVYQMLANAMSLGVNDDFRQGFIDKAMSTAPRGSGFDCGTKLVGQSTDKRIMFRTDYHHMNDNGVYDGWTDHIVTIVPAFIGGFDIKVSGRNRNGIKDYIGDVFHEWLNQEIY